MHRFSTICLAASILMLGISLPVNARHTITVEKGEKWWGGFVAKGVEMPYKAGGETYNLKLVNYNNQSAPLLLSSHGRYIWSEQPFEYRFTDDNTIEIADDIDIDITRAGKTLREAYLDASARHFPFTGTIPDEIFFAKPQYNTWIELNYNQNQRDIMAYADSIIANGYPTGIFMIDDNWQRYYGNFDFKAERFPSPTAMCDSLHDMGFKIMVWIPPFVSADSREGNAMRWKEYLVKNADDKPAIIEWWNGFSAAVDLTNPQAAEHFRGKLLDAMERYHIDGYKFDAGDIEIMSKAPCGYADSTATDHDYARLWAEFGGQFKYNELRSAWKAGGKPIVQRLGDKDYAWHSLHQLVADAISAGLLGYAYCCPDMIGGGMLHTFMNADGPFDEELFIRSCQIHAMMPMMQFSAAPWRVLSPEGVKICADYARRHADLGEYITAAARHAAATGEPIVRHMEYAFPGQGFEECST